MTLIEYNMIMSLLLLLTIGITVAQLERNIVFTNVTYTSDQNFWNLTMWLNESRLSLNIVIGAPTVDVTMDLKLYVNTDVLNGEYVNFISSHIAFCQFLENPESDAFFNIFYQAMLMNKNNNIFRKCPIVTVRFKMHIII